jgi:hypothetical protein
LHTLAFWKERTTSHFADICAHDCARWSAQHKANACANNRKYNICHN